MIWMDETSINNTSFKIQAYSKKGETIENNYLLIEDIILNKNIFDSDVTDYVVLKQI